MGDTNSPDNDAATRVSDSKLTSRFVFKHSLGVGGMGEVYLAEDSSLRRPVAIKTIRPDLSRDPEVRKRIERECLLHAKVGPHPHIVTLYDKLEEGGRLNLVMEYVEGETLQQYLERNQKSGTVPRIDEAVGIAIQVLDALARIHAHGIVHRDIKPSNIILVEDDSGGICAKLMDFGIARGQDDEFASRLTQENGSGPGTPLYMAPEQIDPQAFGEISPATDVYAMGIMLYQMTSGEPPFTGSITHIFNGHLRSAPPPLRERARGRVPDMLAEIVECALAKSPLGRFSTAKAFREELLRVSTMLGVTPSPCETMPSHTSSKPAISDPVMTMRAGAVPMADSGSTQLSGSSRLSPLGRRGGRQITGLLVGVFVVMALAVAAWFVVSSLMKGKDEAKADEKPAPQTEPAPVPAESTAPAPAAPAPVAPAAGPAAPASPAPSPDEELPVGFGSSPASPAPAPAAAAPEPARPDSGASASDILSQGLANRPADTPVPEPAPSVAASVPSTPEPPKAEKPKTTTPAKSAKPKTTTTTNTEAAAEKPKESTTADTSTPAPANSGWTEVSTEARKIK